VHFVDCEASRHSVIIMSLGASRMYRGLTNRGQCPTGEDSWWAAVERNRFAGPTHELPTESTQGARGTLPHSDALPGNFPQDGFGGRQGDRSCRRDVVRFLTIVSSPFGVYVGSLMLFEDSPGWILARYPPAIPVYDYFRGVCYLLMPCYCLSSPPQ
jgi:hypothetical protein